MGALNDDFGHISTFWGHISSGARGHLQRPNTYENKAHTLSLNGKTMRFGSCGINIARVAGASNQELVGLARGGGGYVIIRFATL